MKLTRIVAVEDESIIALNLKQQLRGLGYEVCAIAASGAEALKAIAEFSPDLVLMDIRINGELDGIETAQRIPAGLGIPVIYLSAYSEDATLDRARATRPYGYLIKPYSERELHATIQMALERRQVEVALRDSEERFRTIFAAVSEGIFIAEAQTGLFNEVNEPGAVMLGYGAAELVGRDIETISSGIAPYTMAEALQWIQKAVESGQPLRFPWVCKTRSGVHVPVEVGLRATTLGGRQVVLAVLRDMSEHLAMQAELLQAQKMEAVGRLTGGIAHDFNNLLGVIIGNLDLLRSLRPNDRELDELSGEALQASLRGADLTRRLLAFARRQPLQPRSIAVNGLVGETAKLFRRVLGQNIEISVQYDDEACWVRADFNQLETALSNLITNARDAMPKGGRLTISTRHARLEADTAGEGPALGPGDYVVIAVSDTGTGMEPQVLKRIFEPFYTTKAPDQGTGLGLSMVYGFIKQSGGNVTVDSEPGRGTTICLYLPEVAPAAAQIAAPASDGAAAPSHGECVLVVEDNGPLRRVSVRQLRELGYFVLEAKNSAQALAQLEANRVDILFTDVVMPGGQDGLEMAEAARARWPGLKVLATSGFPGAGQAEAFEAGSMRLLPKPYRKSELAEILRELLDGPLRQTEGDPIG